jgi:hypothetical protein
MAWRYAEPALESPDSRMTLLLCHAALDGLLRLLGEGGSLLVPRVALLVQGSVAEGRRLRPLLRQWRELRGYTAHGQPMPEQTVLRFVDRYTPPTDPSAFQEYDLEMRQRCLRLLRRVYLSVLCLAVRTSDGSDGPIPGMTRTQILEQLDRASRNEPSTLHQLKIGVPDIVRSIGI